MSVKSVKRRYVRSVVPVSVAAATIFALTVLVWLRWPLFHAKLYRSAGWGEHSVSTNEPGQSPSQGYGLLGDAYGAFNAMVSGLAFVGIIATLALQMMELRQQRILTRKQSRSMQQARARDAAGRVVARWHDLLPHRNRVFRWVTRDRGADKRVPIFPEDFESDVAESVIVMMNFFEEWGSLERLKAIDSEYIGAMLGFHANWFYRNVFMDLSVQVRNRHREGSTQELVEPLAVCWRFVFRPRVALGLSSVDRALAALNEIPTGDPEPV